MSNELPIKQHIIFTRLTHAGHNRRVPPSHLDTESTRTAALQRHRHQLGLVKPSRPANRVHPTKHVPHGLSLVDVILTVALTRVDRYHGASAGAAATPRAPAATAVTARGVLGGREGEREGGREGEREGGREGRGTEGGREKGEGEDELEHSHTFCMQPRSNMRFNCLYTTYWWDPTDGP